MVNRRRDERGGRIAAARHRDNRIAPHAGPPATAASECRKPGQDRRRRTADDYRNRVMTTPVGGGGRCGSAPPVTFLGGRTPEPAGGITYHFHDAASRDRQGKQAEAEVEAFDREIAELDRRLRLWS